MIKDLRKPKVLKRIGELIAIGMGPEDIRSALKEEFKIEADTRTISNVIKTYAIRREEIIKQDKKYSDIYKEIIMDLIDKVKSNLKIVEDLRKLVVSRLEVYKDMNEDKGMIIYIKEINSAVRTFNDSIKTMNELLKRLEVETKETKISTVKAVQLSMDSLKELEKDGMITINKDFYIEKEVITENERENIDREGDIEEEIES